jgi:hypothetical protein
MRIKINIILGALITLLTGCKTQQAPAVPENRIMVMYGPPAYFQQQETQQNDTIQQEQITEDQSKHKLSNSK